MQILGFAHCPLSSDCGQAEAKTPEGCRLHGHGEEQRRLRSVAPLVIVFSKKCLAPVSHRSPGNVCLLPDCYVADELVVSRAGRRVRVGNTDAEGRMVMADLLCEMKEKVWKLEETPNASLSIRTPPSPDSHHVAVCVCAGGAGSVSGALHHCHSDWSCHQSHGSQLLSECFSATWPLKQATPLII